MGSLRWPLVSVTTAAMVTSDPVPAVVGTAYSGNIPRITRNMPVMSRMLRLGFLPRAATALAASITEPPPRAMTPSQLLSNSTFTVASICSTVGSGFTSS